jgi:ABC-type glycerol-3-phosphate transport system substrate-binding protein
MSEDDACYLVCKNNITSRDGNGTNGPVRLEFITSDHGKWIKDIARRFEALHGGSVEVNFLVVSANKLSEEIVNEAMGRTAIFDGYVTPPAVSGSVVEFDAWADFTPFLNESSSNLVDWSDVLIGYRQIATVEKQILMYPLDGDLLSLYYRKDVLEAFGLQVPRTWDEYNIVAEATHGKVFENKTLSGYVRNVSVFFCTSLRLLDFSKRCLSVVRVLVV